MEHSKSFSYISNLVRYKIHKVHAEAKAGCMKLIHQSIIMEQLNQEVREFRSNLDEFHQEVREFCSNLDEFRQEVREFCKQCDEDTKQSRAKSLEMIEFYKKHNDVLS